mmetsp:Transcript_79780/g.247463  ORF Transcript_79780/g.247463 Transcript_79780/m.247463 type:complete len:350 (+) Transcript_79780:71-1120(+)
MPDGFRRITHEQHEDLLRTACNVQEHEDPLDRVGPGQKKLTRKKVVEVPYTVKVQVPVHSKVHSKGMEEKVVTGVELVPVQRFKDVKETVIEYKEEKVKGVKEIWVKKEVPYERVVRKPVEVVKTKRVPYTDYEEKQVHMKVKVPCDKVEVRTGYREDKITKTKLVEVEQDLHLHHGPVVVREGTPRLRELPGGGRHHGVTERGKEVVRDEGSRFLTGPDGPHRSASTGQLLLSTDGRRARPHSATASTGRLSLTPSEPGGRREAKVRLRKPDGHAFGIHFDCSDGETIKVTKVKPGHFMANFNERNPRAQIAEGDRIVEVNGVRGNAKKLMDACLKTTGDLDITVARR